MLGNNLIALVVTLAMALVWLRFNDWMAHRGVISSQLSRKLIHMGTGPIFVLCWLLFDGADISRWLAALVPAGITLQFALVGLGVLKDQQAVKAMSRTGDRREILRGPLFYGIVFILLTLIFWKYSPIGMVALMVLCGGDGLADIVGKRVRSAPIPWSPKKTVAGSITVLAGGWVLSTLILLVFTSLKVIPGMIGDYLTGITVIAFASMVIESLPFRDIDNLTVPAVSVALGMLFWG